MLLRVEGVVRVELGFLQLVEERLRPLNLLVAVAVQLIQLALRQVAVADMHGDELGERSAEVGAIDDAQRTVAVRDGPALLNLLNDVVETVRGFNDTLHDLTPSPTCFPHGLITKY